MLLRLSSRGTKVEMYIYSFKRSKVSSLSGKMTDLLTFHLWREAGEGYRRRLNQHLVIFFFLFDPVCFYPPMS